jgi:hypothetical protein
MAGQVNETEDRVYLDYSTPARELYDLGTDPFQLENVAEERLGERATLAARLEALRGCSGDGCRAAEGG